MIPLLILMLLQQPIQIEEEPEPKIEIIDGYLRCTTQECTVADAILTAAVTYNIPLHRLQCLARRESTNNPNAYNAAGPYYGLMQFDRPTWQLTPYSHRSMYDEYASASAAAYLISIGQGHRWPVWRYC